MGNHNGNNGNGFKKGYDPNRFANKQTGLSVYTDELGIMLRERVSPELVSDYMYSTMLADDTSKELGIRIAIEIMNRGCGAALPADKHYALQRQMAADSSFSDLSNTEIEQRIAALYDELDKRNRVEKILNEYEQSLNE